MTKKVFIKCAKCGLFNVGFGIYGELCEKCEDEMKKDSMGKEDK